METKHITTTAILKAEGDEGRLEAVFSTFGVVDRDGDIVQAGAIPDGQAVPMVWAHDWTKPIGKGVTQVDSERAIFKGDFFLDTTAGQDAYRTVKAMADLQQYSWGFRVLDASPGEVDGQTIRVIKRAELFEVSPVLVGAGLGTGTLSLKHGQPFADHAETVLAAVSDFVARSRSLADLRLKEGRVLSSANRDRLAAIADALASASQDLGTILKETEPAKAFDPDELLFAFLATEAKLNGVSLP